MNPRSNGRAKNWLRKDKGEDSAVRHHRRHHRGRTYPRYLRRTSYPQIPPTRLLPLYDPIIINFLGRSQRRRISFLTKSPWMTRAFFVERQVMDVTGGFQARIPQLGPARNSVIRQYQ
jgi:hypothetical protein